MISSDRRLRLVAKLIALTQLKKISWQRRDSKLIHGKFTTIVDKLRFELQHKPLEGQVLWPTLVMEIWDEDETNSEPIDSFSERDGIPILGDLFDFVERNDSEFSMAAAKAAAKIDKFLARDVSHVQ
ncbi:MAG: hypothetical protein WCF85_17735 [Rhodospirillaceae bacterium]